MLEQTTWTVEDVKRELNKLYEFVTPEVTIDKICWHIKDNVDSLKKIVKMSLNVVGSPSPPLSAYWDWDEEHAFRDEEFGPTDADWAAEEGIDWEELEDQWMNWCGVVIAWLCWVVVA
jgi:hypothetical protein